MFINCIQFIVSWLPCSLRAKPTNVFVHSFMYVCVGTREFHVNILCSVRSRRGERGVRYDELLYF